MAREGNNQACEDEEVGKGPVRAGCRPGYSDIGSACVLTFYSVAAFSDE